jgi:hypothetical protein
MHTLQVEHSVRDYETWKATFDSDPLGREQEGVIAYRVYQPLDDTGYVVIDLDFEDSIDAEGFRVALRELMAGAEAEGLISESRVRILKQVDAQRY